MIPDRNVHFVSLGCPKNRVDAEHMLAILGVQGWQAVDDPERAEAIVVNTCAFIEASKEESVDAILDMAQFKNSGRCKALVVSGCLAQRYADQLAEEMPEVDYFLGTAEYAKIGEVLARAAGMPRRIVSDPDFVATSAVPRVNSMPRHTAYLKIAEGCSNKCAFCIIPTLRGLQNSREIDDLVIEAKRLANSGVRELILVAQDLTAYGVDLPGRPQLHDLVAQLAEIEGLSWIRLMYAYPRNIKEPLLELMRDHPKVLPYLDMPIQHIDGAMLKRMKRATQPEKIRSILHRLKAEVPGLTMRTTFIVGYPGETEEEFQALYDFVEEMEFQRVGVFRYSQEEGTPAALLDGQVSEKIKADRQAAIMELQAGIHERHNKALIGRCIEVLVDGVSDETELLLQGRSNGQAPEIDGITYINDGWAEPGDLVRLRIDEVHGYDLVGGIEEVIRPAAKGVETKGLEILG
ncbi:MAG: 30S ribosomal protein S12 methylthiotransferase RimO [Myxococcota bacterium]|jgi:ribosomal protein S12 methylthiotransferase|nr:30S ribosomal protein S12 methylthiotransferase RimO [Myxococcota bacterium]